MVQNIITTITGEHFPADSPIHSENAEGTKWSVGPADYGIYGQRAEKYTATFECYELDQE